MLKYAQADATYADWLDWSEDNNGGVVAFRITRAESEAQVKYVLLFDPFSHETSLIKEPDTSTQTETVP